MFDNLSDKFSSLFSKFSGKKSLTEDNVADAIREVRLALLDADVNYKVAKQFILSVKEKALGQAVEGKIKASDQFVSIIHQEMVELLGKNVEPLNLRRPFARWMLVGLQGAGKTTQAAKLAHYLVSNRHYKKPLLVACDLSRPAAVEQLRILAQQIGVGFYAGEGSSVKVAKAGLQKAREEGFDSVIFDTAGRLHIDEELMKELEKIKEVTASDELLFVANSAMGQSCVEVAKIFHERLSITGAILTMLDSDARGGAAISFYSMTQQPIRFEGIGEKIDDFQLFSVESMADRILGMGDTINLVRKAKEQFDEKQSKELEEKMRKASFTYEDYLKQMQAVKKMGSLSGIMKMMPKKFQLPDLKDKEEEIAGTEAIILSMTPDERRTKVELTLSRVKRIARGSGRSVGEVNRLKKSFLLSKKFLKKSSSQKLMDKFIGGK